MAGLDVNGVGATQGANGNYALKAQDDKNEFINSSFGQGYGASGGGQVNNPAPSVINTYGGDIANFSKFKGNDRNDAMRLTNSAANDVKKQYMQLQHEYPGIELQFEPMPNPQTAGKKREGFFNYQQQLDDWKDNAMTQINNARERNTVEVVDDAVAAVNQNTNEKSSMNAALTIGYGEANLEATENEGVKTRRAVHVESAITRNVVRTESAGIKNTVNDVGTDIQNTIHEEATTTRETVRKVGKDTQEITTLSNKVSDNLNNYPHTSATKNAVGNLRDKIVSSNLTAEEKTEMLDDLAGWAGQAYIGGEELEAKRKEVDNKLVFGEQEQPEVPELEAPPLREYPANEDPFVKTEIKNSPKTPSGYDRPFLKNSFTHNGSKSTDGKTKSISALPKSDTPPAPSKTESEPSVLDKKTFRKK